MTKWGGCNMSELLALQKRMEQLTAGQLDLTYRRAAQEVAKLLLNKTKKRTPTGEPPRGIDPDTYEEYWSGYVGGTLRDSWVIEGIEKLGNEYRVTMVNEQPYTSYVEYGHRQTPGRYVPALGKRLKSSWVDGKFMMTISRNEVAVLAPKLLEAAIYQTLKEAF